jgi:hypothetical protein
MDFWLLWQMKLKFMGVYFAASGVSLANKAMVLVRDEEQHFRVSRVFTAGADGVFPDAGGSAEKI